MGVPLSPMGDDRKEPTERTPQGLEVPIPKREDFLRNLEKTAKPRNGRDDDDGGNPDGSEDQVQR